MQRLLTVLAASLLLTSCGSETLRYELTFDTTDENRRTELTLASLRIIQRRLARLGEEALDTDIQRQEGKTFLKVEIKDRRIASVLDEELTSPFAIGFYEEAPPDKAEIIVEGHGGFRSTGVGNEHIDWLEASEEPGLPGKGRITLSFSEDGFVRMAEVFTRNSDKFLGLFVRGQLAAKLKVDTEKLKNIIVISELPSVEIAHVFADDVNVGLHVTFTSER